MSFDHLAPHYDWLELITAGQRLQRARCCWLDRLAPCARVLSVGEGHGRFAEAFARRFPDKSLVCVDGSPIMLARGHRRVGRIPLPSTKISWVRAELPGWKPSEVSFDAIVTCFFLDCFPSEELNVVIASLAMVAAPEAIWMNADFSMPAIGPARWRAAAIHRLMYAFFRVTTRLPARRLTPPDAALRANGFRLADRQEWEWGLIRSDCWRRAVPAAR